MIQGVENVLMSVTCREKK